MITTNGDKQYALSEERGVIQRQAFRGGDCVESLHGILKHNSNTSFRKNSLSSGMKKIQKCVSFWVCSSCLLKDIRDS